MDFPNSLPSVPINSCHHRSQNGPDTVLLKWPLVDYWPIRLHKPVTDRTRIIAPHRRTDITVVCGPSFKDPPSEPPPSSAGPTDARMVNNTVPALYMSLPHLIPQTHAEEAMERKGKEMKV